MLTLLQQTLPQYDVNEIHVIEVTASPLRVWQVLGAYRFGSSPLFRFLFSLRKFFGLPAWLIRRQPVRRDWNLAEPPLLEMKPFVKVAEMPNEEVVLGLIGKFWQPAPRPVIVENGEAFLRFNDPAYGKAAMNFHLESTAEGIVRLSTETRVQVTDPRSRFLFKLYWAVIGSFSGLLRIDMLRRIKQEAESNPDDG